MKISIFNWTVEAYVSNNKYGRKFAKHLIGRAANFGEINKISLIKALRMIDENITLVDAKEAVENMFDFSTKYPTIK